MNNSTLKIAVIAVAFLLVISSIGLVGVLSTQNDVEAKERQLLEVQDQIVQLQRNLEVEQQNRTVAETRLQDLSDDIKVVIEQNKRLKQETTQQEQTQQQVTPSVRDERQGQTSGQTNNQATQRRFVNGRTVHDPYDYSYGVYRYIENRNLDVFLRSRGLEGFDFTELENALYDLSLLTPQNCYAVVFFAREIEDDIEDQIKRLERQKDKKEEKLEEQQAILVQAREDGDEDLEETTENRVDRYDDQVEEIEDDIDDLERLELRSIKRLRVRADSQCRRFSNGF